jgi:hypothetical protein
VPHIVFMKAEQVGATEAGNNWFGLAALNFLASLCQVAGTVDNGLAEQECGLAYCS